MPRGLHARSAPARIKVAAASAVGGLLLIAQLASATGVQAAATAAPWNPALGYADEHDCTTLYGGSIDQREYGVDVALPAGTAVYAPESGTVVAYQPSSTDWQPGRLIEQLDSGPVVAFGHVNDVVSPSTHVGVGQQIATIGDNGSNSHVEFMFDKTGQGGPGYYTRSFFCPPNPLPQLGAYMNSNPNQGLQVILDAAGQIWAKDTIGNGGWTQESPAGETAIAAGAGGLQMQLDGCGAVWAKNSIGNGGWTQESPCGAKKIAAGGSGLQMQMDSAGQVWAKGAIGNGGWTQETPAGETAIAAGGGGLQMLLDGCGAVWAKSSVGNGGWTQESPCGETRIAAGGNGLQMILDSAGQVWAKNSIGYAGWTQESPAGETAISAGNTVQVIVDAAGQVWAKNSIGYAGWTQETPAGETKAVAGSADQQIVLDAAGQVWAKSIVGSGGWTQESPAGEMAIAAG